MKQSEINIKVSLDENHVPQKITWNSKDDVQDASSECKALMMSLWDAKDMMIDEMKHFFFQSMITMSDTYERATSDTATAEEIREFAKKMGEKILAQK